MDIQHYIVGMRHQIQHSCYSKMSILNDENDRLKSNAFSNIESNKSNVVCLKSNAPRSDLEVSYVQDIVHHTYRTHRAKLETRL